MMYVRISGRKIKQRQKPNGKPGTDSKGRFSGFIGSPRGPKVCSLHAALIGGREGCNWSSPCAKYKRSSKTEAMDKKKLCVALEISGMALGGLMMVIFGAGTYNAIKKNWGSGSSGTTA